MRFDIKTLLIGTAAVFLLLLPSVYLLSGLRARPAEEPVQVLSRYLKALYARDFREAYRFISAADRRFKSQNVYIRERGSFTGMAREAARKLAERIELVLVEQRFDGARAAVKLHMTLPDANAVAPMLLNWDEEQLSRLSLAERKKLLAALEERMKNGALKTIEGEEAFVMTRENGRWRVLLDWASGIRVSFNTTVPAEGPVEARAAIRETVARSGEIFTIAYRVRNRSANDLFARIVHHVEPQSLAGHLDLVECALLLPVRVPPGKEQSYESTYLVRGDLPDGARELKVTYEFKIER